MSFDVHEYYNKLDDGDVLVSFKGSVTTDLINNILEKIEEKMEGVDEQSKVRKKVYNVLVESLQNLYHHVEDLPGSLKNDFDSKFGILVVTHGNATYKISTGNFISSEKIKFLKDKIDKINSLSKDELKDMYKFILNHQKLSAKGGGGLGLVDIARKTGNKLEYTFQHYQDDYYFFNLDVFITVDN